MDWALAIIFAMFVLCGVTAVIGLAYVLCVAEGGCREDE